ncbi:hypothetical protein F4859DRAFT_342771 [Xylaria cf. heliscus]|nr:hypothetical protein F4859DRAFT_342771 [Xylaria cf. heliscus]
MRLLCQYSDGTTVSLPVALQKDPYKVRGLVSAAFFHCLTALPDTSAFVRAEHAVRDALVDFNGDKDRYVKSYVVSRGLDSRTKTTPRASVIHSSFLIGEPLALVGLFYATSDVSRNARNRETLDYFLACPEESRKEMFERASLFPRRPSVRQWFQRIFDKLDGDAQSLAYFLLAVGANRHVVLDLLIKRARQPSSTWDQDGEITMMSPELEPYLSEDSRFDAALRNLKMIGLLKATPDIHINQALATLLSDKLTPWREKATKIVCHAFPKHRSIEPNTYVEQCELLLPCLQHVLSHPVEDIAHPQISFLSQAIRACLSSLCFGDIDWKIRAFTCAQHMLTMFAGKEQREFEILAARLVIHKASTSRDIGGLGLDLASFRDDHRYNALVAELAILKAQSQIDLTDYEKASLEIFSFDASQDIGTSTLSCIINDRVALLRGIIARYKGDFQAAYQVFESLPPTTDVITHLTAVLCEQGHCERAIRMLDGHLQFTPDPNFQLRLAWAQAHLFKCMQVLRDGQECGDAVQIASGAYLSAKSVQGSADAFAVAIGQAILHHIQGSIDLAIQGWITALDAFKSCNLSSTYIEILLSYSQSDLAFKKHKTEDGFILRNQLRLLLGQRSPTYRVLGFGSLWPELLDSWEAV